MYPTTNAATGLTQGAEAWLSDKVTLATAGRTVRPVSHTHERKSMQLGCPIDIYIIQNIYLRYIEYMGNIEEVLYIPTLEYIYLNLHTGSQQNQNEITSHKKNTIQIRDARH